MTRLLQGSALAFTLLLFLPALAVRDPLFARLRPLPLVFLLSFCVLQAVCLVWLLRRKSRGVQPVPAGGPFPVAGRELPVFPLVLWIANLLLGAAAWGSEARFQSTRQRVLATPAAELREPGRHLIVGYHKPEHIRELLRRRAIGGVFVTAQNAADKSRAELAGEIAGFQELQASLGGSRLWIATDQEGGPVSRLSPPLPLRPALSALISPAAGDVSRPGRLDRHSLARIRSHARQQAGDLAAVGVNVNFGPVADLRFSRDEKGQGHISWFDLFSRIESRAIHRDPHIVAEVAFEYSRALAAGGVVATLKHFPGLGRVSADTHWFAANVPASVPTLMQSDWLVYQGAIARLRPAEAPWIMLAHVKLPDIDARWPASTSRAVVSEIARETLGLSGLLVTDDLNMRPTYGGPGGIGGSAVRALNAGVDLLLVSYDGQNAYPVLDAILRARRRGDLDAGILAASAERLRRYGP
jgi:beta-N-acetylhexosaminidase